MKDAASRPASACPTVAEVMREHVVSLRILNLAHMRKIYIFESCTNVCINDVFAYGGPRPNLIDTVFIHSTLELKWP